MKKEEQNEKIMAPIAKREEYSYEIHGKTYEDPYFWLRGKEKPEVISYLEAENAYTKAQMEGTVTLQRELYEEMKGRIKETDMSAPVEVDEYFYYTRTEAGKDYPIFCRKHGSLEAEEEILLDQNEIERNHAHCSLGSFSVSPDHRLLAYSLDTDGSEEYDIYIKDLGQGTHLEDTIRATAGDLVWKEDSKTFFYTTLDDIHRPFRVFSHTLGKDTRKDLKVYEEEDRKFNVGLSKSKSRQYIFIHSESKETGEVRFFSAKDDDGKLQLVAPRVEKCEYSVEHHGEHFYILTNDTVQNFRLVKAPIDHLEKEHWQEVATGTNEMQLLDIEVFEYFLCIYELREGLTSIRVCDLRDESEHYVPTYEAVYELSGGANPDYASETIRLVTSSLTSPARVYEYDMKTGGEATIKTEEVLGDFDPNDYRSERVYAEAEDGTKIPVSLVYRKDTKLGTGTPSFLLGYGSYGIMQEPGFRKLRLSLLDRGFVFAIAHIRGGGEKGMGWYQDGKYLKKKNTFTDYIAVAEYLIEKEYTSSEKLLACGGSAGGLLMGAVVNERPELFGAMVADVPFVDVMNTMLDETIPLTVDEYEEWGNPNDPEYFEYMRSYSPYDNVRAQDYPPMLVTAGLNDPRVAYWEPAKWVAKLRANKTDDNLLLLKTNMEHGHAGASARYKFLEETAFEYAFVLKALGLT